jgi:acyl-coenzyme A thioesterase 13
MVVTELSDGAATAEFRVDGKMCNAFGTLHGGATGTVVDILGTLALVSLDHTRPGVSVEINTTYLAAAKAGDVVEAKGKVLKAGRSLGFTTVELRLKEAGTLIASGSHTKAFAAKKK